MRLPFVALATITATPAFAQFGLDVAASEKWSNATIIHFEVVGEVADPHVQIPPTDADLYADVTDRVTLSFDWDKSKNDFVGKPTFQNFPGQVSNLMGMDKGCPTGSVNGPYEHFDIVEVRRMDGGGIELVGKRVHPETSVAESCGTGRRVYPGAETPKTEYIAPPDPTMLAFAQMLPADGPIKVTPDGSMVMRALNNNWIWTFKPTVK